MPHTRTTLAADLRRLGVASGDTVMVHAAMRRHHAEDLARFPGKRIRRVEVPLATGRGVEWRMVEEFETGEPVVAGLAEDYFGEVVRDFLATGEGRQAPVGDAPSVLVEAAPMCAFGVAWLERWASTG